MAESVVIRCDGGDSVGAGHVSRCLPIAQALEARGVDVRFAGDFDGVAAWMLGRHGAKVEPLVQGPCGIDPRRWAGAVVDLYLADGSAHICELAAEIPVATIGEAARCADAGLWIDYHAGATPGATDRRLGGPTFAPVDPRFAATRRKRAEVRRILVMAGASNMFGDTPARIADAVAESFADDEVVAPASIADATERAVSPLPTPFDLAEIAPGIDLAVVAAGMTTYELVSAGIPLVAIALVENQRVVIDGCRASGIALPVDGIGRDPLPELAAALARLQEPELRARLSDRGTTILDGHGADRIADALLAAWAPDIHTDSAR